MSNISGNHVTPERIPSSITSLEYNGKISPISHNKKNDCNIDTTRSRIHQGRRIRRCNWVRFLTVCEKDLNEGSQHDGKEYLTNKVLGTQENSIRNNNKLHPNIECRLTETGQVVYEAMESLEPSTELIVQFKHPHNPYVINNNNNNNNKERFDKCVNKTHFFSPKDALGTSFGDILPFPVDMNIFCSSRAIANMLLIDTISGIIKGKNVYV